MEENESFLAFSLHLALVMMQVTPLTEQCPAAFVCWKKAGFFSMLGPSEDFFTCKKLISSVIEDSLLRARETEGRILQLIFVAVSADVSTEFPELHNHRSFYFSSWQSVWRSVKKARTQNTKLNPHLFLGLQVSGETEANRMIFESLTGCGKLELALSSCLSIGCEMGPGCVLQSHCFLRYLKKSGLLASFMFLQSRRITLNCH